jgi:hypothetical protein
MSKLRVQCFALSLDGYGAGPNQDLENPLGIRGPECHRQRIMLTDAHVQALFTPWINDRAL